MHEQSRFASIDAGVFQGAKKEFTGTTENSKEPQVKLLLKDRSKLPAGYEWEEAGREFSYKGQFYDIVSLKHTQNGWELTAFSDEAETEIVNNQNKASNLEKEASATSKSSSKFKIKISKLVYDYVASDELATETTNFNIFPGFRNNHSANPFLAIFTPPPEAV